MSETGIVCADQPSSLLGVAEKIEYRLKWGGGGGEGGYLKKKGKCQEIPIRYILKKGF